MRFIFIVLLLLGCSTSKRANWHINRAIKLDPTIVKTDVDTIVKTIEKDGVITFAKDTVIDNQFVFISVVHTGDNTQLYWKIKKFDVEIPVQHTTIIPPKTRYEIRKEYKYKGDSIKYIYKTIQSKNKTVQSIKQKKDWNLFLFGILFGVLVTILFPIIIKKNFS